MYELLKPVEPVLGATPEEDHVVFTFEGYITVPNTVRIEFLSDRRVAYFYVNDDIDPVVHGCRWHNDYWPNTPDQWRLFDSESTLLNRRGLHIEEAARMAVLMAVHGANDDDLVLSTQWEHENIAVQTLDERIGCYLTPWPLRSYKTDQYDIYQKGFKLGCIFREPHNMWSAASQRGGTAGFHTSLEGAVRRVLNSYKA